MPTPLWIPARGETAGRDARPTEKTYSTVTSGYSAVAQPRVPREALEIRGGHGPPYEEGAETEPEGHKVLHCTSSVTHSPPAFEEGRRQGRGERLPRPWRYPYFKFGHECATEFTP